MPIIIVSFSYIYVSQGSVATPLGCDGIYGNHFIANIPERASERIVKIG